MLTSRCRLLPGLLAAAWLWLPLAAIAAPEPPAAATGASPAPAARGATDSPGVRVVSARERLQQAIAHYQQSEFEEAHRLLQEILEAIGSERSRTAQEAYTYLAFVQVAFGEKEQAVQAFERALEVQPELTLSAPSPSIANALSQARRRYRARIRALDHDPPGLQHVPPAAGNYREPLLLLVRASDPSGVKRVVLSCRTRGNRGFSTVTMERDRQGGAFVASVPATLVSRPGVEYFIEAWDDLGNGPGLKGSHLAPILVPVEGGSPPGQSAALDRSWYRRWWVWALVAGAAATAGGISAGLYLNREESGRLDIHWDKELAP